MAAYLDAQSVAHELVARARGPERPSESEAHALVFVAVAAHLDACELADEVAARAGEAQHLAAGLDAHVVVAVDGAAAEARNLGGAVGDLAGARALHGVGAD